MKTGEKIGPDLRPPAPALGGRLGMLLARLLDGAMRDAARAIAFKAAGAVLMLAAFALAARVMDKAGFGTLVVWFNGLSFVVVVAQVGQETWIARSWHEHLGAGRDAEARGALARAFATVLVTGTIIGLGAAIFAVMTGQGAYLAASAFLFVLALTVFAVSIPASRTIVGIGAGDGHGEVTWRSLILAGCALLAVSGATFEAPDFLLIAALAGFASVALQVSAIRRALPESVRRARGVVDGPAWRRRSASMWASSLIDATSQFLEVLFVGLLLGPAMAAGYFAAGRLAAAFAMLSGGITNFALRAIAKDFFAGRAVQVQATLRRLAVAVAAAVAIGLAGILAVGGHLLTLFGADYAVYHTTLVLLSLGTAAVALGGPASAVLVLTGHERLHAVLLGASVAARLGAVAIGALAFGAVGAAAAYAATIATTTIVLVVVARRLVGLDPSIFSLFARSRVEIRDGAH
ncbi:lipopolysaccharide biosynthesis protein [Salinarimonas ramus]|uniref:Membrane protein involved in the export of O-antigen and teichoic acid n=1 Tax=Salinarimonas ramus TaxID=690164 RepID=A0A917Q9F5_9HYPH|nr:polysaccharide biosynthesis C-terminal domain-containing protein [Salinarimonas ramus]GGK34075.1 hypothetical protein GCM10011322_20960 [Salinarimonas ramus]